MAEPILFIAGLGRCGTTMVMRMLDKGGNSVCPDLARALISANCSHLMQRELAA